MAATFIDASSKTVVNFPTMRKSERTAEKGKRKKDDSVTDRQESDRCSPGAPGRSPFSTPPNDNPKFSYRSGRPRLLEHQPRAILRVLV